MSSPHIPAFQNTPPVYDAVDEDDSGMNVPIAESDDAVDMTVEANVFVPRAKVEALRRKHSLERGEEGDVFQNGKSAKTNTREFAPALELRDPYEAVVEDTTCRRTRDRSGTQALPRQRRRPVLFPNAKYTFSTLPPPTVPLPPRLPPLKLPPARPVSPIIFPAPQSFSSQARPAFGLSGKSSHSPPPQPTIGRSAETPHLSTPAIPPPPPLHGQPRQSVHTTQQPPSRVAESPTSGDVPTQRFATPPTNVQTKASHVPSSSVGYPVQSHPPRLGEHSWQRTSSHVPELSGELPTQSNATPLSPPQPLVPERAVSQEQTNISQWNPQLQPEQIVHVVHVVHSLYSRGQTTMTDQQAWATWMQMDTAMRKNMFVIYTQYQGRAAAATRQPTAQAAASAISSATPALAAQPMCGAQPQSALRQVDVGQPSTAACQYQVPVPRQGLAGIVPVRPSELTLMNTEDDIVLPFGGSCAQDIEMSESLRKTQKKDPKGKRKASAHAIVIEEDEDEQPIVQERTLNARPMPAHPSDRGFVGADIAELVVGKIHDLTLAVHDQAEAQKGFAGEMKELREAFGQLRMAREAPPPEKRARTVREEKLAGDTPRRQKKDRKVEEKLLRQRGRRPKGDQSKPVEEPEDVHMTRLKARVRHILAEMLQIIDWKHAATQYPALTEDQVDAYLARDPALVPTVDRLIVDFSPGRGWKQFSLNREARKVIIDKYFARVAGGAFSHKPTPPEMLTRETVGQVLDAHMKYCRGLWRDSKTPPTKEDLLKIMRRICRNSRKSTLYESREVTLLRRGYTRHRALFRLLEPANMSGDETDGPKKTHPPVWRIVIAAWQSEELRNFLWALDRMYREDWARKRVGGNPPRVRIVREGIAEEGYPAHGLWRNCYDKDWLAAQPYFVVEELEIVDEDYDFTL